MALPKSDTIEFPMGFYHVEGSVGSDEKKALDAYYKLLTLTENGVHVTLEEYAREMIVNEEMHLDEVNKMLRNPGSIEVFKE